MQRLRVAYHFRCRALYNLPWRQGPTQGAEGTRAIGGGTGVRMGLGSPTFISRGACPPTFCLNMVSLSNTVSIGSSDKVNRLMKKKRCRTLAVFSR